MIVNTLANLFINMFLVPFAWIKLTFKVIELKKGKLKNCLFIFFFYIPLSIIILAKETAVFIVKLFQRPIKKVS